MLDNIEVLIHSSIKFNKGKVIYFDPFRINKNYNDADIIFITHEHYDHFSSEDILKVMNKNTKIVVPISMKEVINTSKIKFKEILYVKPSIQYEIDGLKFDVMPSYNINKSFHPKEKNWVGYILTINNVRYYVAGDTDLTQENINVSCDVAFVPIGGIYTMDYIEASELINKVKPKIVVPIHYGSIVGNTSDGVKFKNLIDENIECKLMIK